MLPQKQGLIVVYTVLATDAATPLLAAVDVQRSFPVQHLSEPNACGSTPPYR